MTLCHGGACIGFIFGVTWALIRSATVLKTRVGRVWRPMVGRPEKEYISTAIAASAKDWLLYLRRALVPPSKSVVVLVFLEESGILEL